MSQPDLLDDYLELLLEGQAPSIEGFCKQHPHRPELPEQLRRIASLHEGLKSLHAPQTATLAPGDTFAGYRILSFIARGGMGAVYLAKHQDAGSAQALLALKVIAKEVGTPRFDREVKALKTLKHPLICELIDAGTATLNREPLRYLVTPFVAGLSLRQLLDQRPESAPLGPSWLVGALKTLVPSSALARKAQSEGPVAVIVELVVGLAQALEHAHKHGVIHRDLKPANIIVGFEGRITLVDFGLATLIEDTSLTMPGVFVGSPGYASPEQILGEATTPQTDIYGLGAVLFELLCGQAPFANTTRPTQAPGPRDLVSFIPARLDDVVRQCLHPDPAQRYRSMGALGQALSPRPTTRFDPDVLGHDPQPLDEGRRGTTVRVSPRRVSSDHLKECFQKSAKFIRRAHADLSPHQVLLVVAHESRSNTRTQVLSAGHDLSDATLTMGRHQSCPVRLTGDPTVPLRHLWVSIRQQAGELWVRVIDLRTDHGVWVRGAGQVDSIQAQGPVWLKSGRYVLGLLPAGVAWGATTAGTWQLWSQIRTTQEPGAPGFAQAQGDDFAKPTTTISLLPPPGALSDAAVAQEESLAGWVEIHRATNRVQCALSTQMLQRGVLLGRYTRCEVGGADLWDDTLVSRVHALLLGDPGRGGLEIYDLASHNGVKHNGKSVRAATVSPSDTVTIGASTLRWVPA